MIPVERQLEPPSFEAEVRDRGRRWLEKTAARGTNRRPPNYWSACEGDLREVFRGRCGWAAIRISSGHVEHWVSQTKCLEAGGDPSLIYEWTNYRYAMPELNSSKGERPDLLDPYDVQAGWFRLRLPSLEVELLIEAVPEPHRTRAQATMRRFKLADNPKIVRLRRGYLLSYQSGDVTLRFLREHDPMLAMALEELFSAEEEALSVVQRGFRAKLARSRHMAGATTP